MANHLFYHPQLQDSYIEFDEEHSKHMAVLRLHPGDIIKITNGKGMLAKATVSSGHRKKITAEVSERSTVEETKPAIAMAVSLTKNTSRFEWFLEKATELGINHIIPLVCTRTEKQKLRMDRMHNILVSAMLQSQQTWLPQMDEPMEMSEAIELPFEKKLIAHCADCEKNLLQNQKISEGGTILLIGPEGDFTEDEIKAAIDKHYLPVSIGATRLRTETAGVAGASWLSLQRQLQSS